MLGYLVRRVITMLVTLAIISVLVFVIIKLPPGDYLTTYIEELRAQGEAVDQGRIDYLRKRYGLDQPGYVQYWNWATGLLRGDLGWSFEYDQPVSQVVGETLFLTIVLKLAVVLFVYAVAFPIGVYSATHQYSWSDHGLTFLGFLGIAVPNFLFALMILYAANVWFGTSIGGLMDPSYIDKPWSLSRVGSVLEHLWAPVLVIGITGTAGMIRRLRANLLDELQKQYVTTARAKGLPERRLLIR